MDKELQDLIEFRKKLIDLFTHQDGLGGDKKWIDIARVHMQEGISALFKSYYMTKGGSDDWGNNTYIKEQSK